MTTTPHPSGSPEHSAAEALILDALGVELGIELRQGAEVSIGTASVRPDGVDEGRSIFVEVSAHVGKLKGGQRHKVSTDALKQPAIRDAHPNARLILAFADEEAAASVSGWKSEMLRRNAIEIRAVDLGPDERAKIEAAQRRQRMVNAGE